jgi:hypothetical protein
VSDDGRPDVRLAAALSRWTGDASPAARAEVLAALAGARVFLALAARATGTEVSTTTGMRQERGAEMALLSVVSGSGARALPVFADGHQVQRWRAEARPVPVPGPQACATALDDDAVALLLDPPGAAMAVTRAELTALAQGRVPVPGTRLDSRRTQRPLGPLAATADPDLVAALTRALTGEPITAARLLQGPDGPVLGVVPGRPAGPAELAALAGRVAGRLGPLLPAGGLDLAVVPADGPGHPVPLRPSRWRRRAWPSSGERPGHDQAGGC